MVLPRSHAAACLLCGLVLEENGYYIAQGLATSPYSWAVMGFCGRESWKPSRHPLGGTPSLNPRWSTRAVRCEKDPHDSISFRRAGHMTALATNTTISS